MSPSAAGPNRYSNTPRKVFDKHVDRMEEKRLRDKQDHRADLKAIFSRLKNLENQLELLHEHVESHCHVLSGGDDHQDDEDNVQPEEDLASEGL